MSTEQDLLHPYLLREQIKEMQESEKRMKEKLNRELVVGKVIESFEEQYYADCGFDDGLVSYEVEEDDECALIHFSLNGRYYETLRLEPGEGFEKFKARMWSNGMDNRDEFSAMVEYYAEKGG